MLRIAEHWHGSDLGLQRQGNEDNYFVRSPLFVVADGMGGAQAGEVASEMAVEAFAPGLPDGQGVGPGLRHIIEEANRHINERSRTQSGRAGMGTTVTAAHVGEHVVTIAHVGDSRCYVARDGKLKRITTDHSLVAELVARGKPNRAIARHLGIGERTVEGYVAGALGKLGFTSRTQLAAWAVAVGMGNGESGMVSGAIRSAAPLRSNGRG